MPKKLKKSSQAPRTRKPVMVKEVEPVFEPDVTFTEPATHETKQQNRSAIFGGVVVVLIIAGILLFKNGMLLAAVVGGKPIFTWQVSSELMRRYGKQTLDAMITEKMIVAEAAKSGISIDQKDVDARENEMVKQFGPDVKLDELLKYQGITKQDLDKQIQIQLQVEKILSKDLSITDADVSEYLASNSGKFTATEEATLKEQARSALTQEKITAKIQPWFNKVKENTKVVRFINE